MSTGVVVRFSQLDYSAPEQNEEIVVTVQTEGRHASNLTVQVVPLSFNDYLALGKQLPEDFPDVPDFNTKCPNRANSRQHNVFTHLLLIFGLLLFNDWLI